MKMIEGLEVTQLPLALPDGRPDDAATAIAPLATALLILRDQFDTAAYLQGLAFMLALVEFVESECVVDSEAYGWGESGRLWVAEQLRLLRMGEAEE
jgi:hypothetical protein